MGELTQSSREPALITQEKIIQTLKERELEEGYRSLLTSDPNRISCLKIPTALMLVSEFQIVSEVINDVTSKTEIETISENQQPQASDQKTNNDHTETEIKNTSYQILDEVKFNKIMQQLTKTGWCDQHNNWIDRFQGYRKKACCIVLWMQTKKIISNSPTKEVHLIAKLIFNINASESTAKNIVLKDHFDDLENMFKI